jgi:hypothetical protein
MIVTGNVNGDVVVRNLLNNEGSPVNRGLEMQEAHDQGTSEVILSHNSKDQQGPACEVTSVKFSVVKRHIMASAYKNGQVIIWDTQGIFTKSPHGLS